MRANKTGAGWIIAGIIFLLAGAYLLGFNLYTQYTAGKASEAILSTLENGYTEAQQRDEAENAKAEELPLYVINPEMEMPVKTVDGNDYIGILSIPSLALTLPVMSDWDNQRLSIAPCRYSGSVYQDNMVICAHNFDTHFGNIKKLMYGDIVDFMDAEGNVFHYTVSEQEILDSTSIEEMTDSEWELTLFTCTPGGTARVTVRCERAQ